MHHQTPKDFFEDKLVRACFRIGSPAIDFNKADKKASNLFKKNSSKTKNDLIGDIRELIEKYEKQIGGNGKEPSYDLWLKERKAWKTLKLEEKEKVINTFKQLSKEDLAKALTLAELEYSSQNELDLIGRLHQIFQYWTYAFEGKHEIAEGNGIGALMPTIGERPLWRSISKFINTKYKELFVISSLYRLINKTRVQLDESKSLYEFFGEGKAG
jgi:hypothetical protein